MKIKELLECDKIKLLAGNNLDQTITGVYVGDLLSWVMSHGKKGDCWLTVQTHDNVLAIASLLEIACVIFVENAPFEESIIKKANSEGIVLLTTELTCFEVSKILCHKGY